MAKVDRRVRGLAQRVIAEGKNKRAILALRELLERGEISTERLQELGYDHPPRAIADIKDTGIPILRTNGTSRRGRRMAVYRLGSAEDIQEGRIGGRSALPKKFKVALIARYGSVDCITGGRLDKRVLQIDHRVPYRVAGDAGLEDRNVDDYMLLDGSSQRAKSWSCEHCPNMLVKKIQVCRTCFWASPEKYDHIATEQIRRTDILWQGDDVAVHDKLKAAADKANATIGEVLKRLARHNAKEG